MVKFILKRPTTGLFTIQKRGGINLFRVIPPEWYQSFHENSTRHIVYLIIENTVYLGWVLPNPARTSNSRIVGLYTVNLHHQIRKRALFLIWWWRFTIYKTAIRLFEVNLSCGILQFYRQHCILAHVWVWYLFYKYAIIFNVSVLLMLFIDIQYIYKTEHRLI